MLLRSLLLFLLVCALACPVIAQVPRGGTTTTGGGSGAPDNMSYITRQSEANLSNETALGSLTTGLLLNTVSGGVGTPSAYAGTTCSAGNAIRVLSASGVATCTTAGGVAIGDTITSGTAGSVLYLGTSGVLAQDNAGFSYTTTGGLLLADRSGVSRGILQIGNTPGGGTSGGNMLAINVDGNNADNNHIALRGYNDFVELDFSYANGTLASPTNVTSGKTLGDIVFGGYNSDAGGPLSGAEIIVKADSAFVADPFSAPSHFAFYTSAVERLRITSAGTTGVDATTCTSNGSTHCLAGQVELQNGKLLHTNNVSDPASSYINARDDLITTLTTNASGSHFGQLVNVDISGNFNIGSYTGSLIQMAYSGTGTITQVVGQNITGTWAGSGAFSSAIGLNVDFSGSRSATTKTGIYLNDNGAATTGYGLFIADITGTTNYSIYTGSSPSHFGGAVDVTGATVVTGNLTQTPPTTEAITAGATITGNACAGVKRLSSASAVTTSTSATFTAPAAANSGCHMTVCNMNAADAITLDQNSAMQLTGGANLALAAGCCIDVISTGAGGFWKQVSAQLCSS